MTMLVLANAACYNDRGAKSAASRLPKMASKILESTPAVVAINELSLGNLPVMDKAMPGLDRAPGGGKGREMYLDPGLTQVDSWLDRTKTMLNGDDKPYAVVVYDSYDGRHAVVCFHNEHENNTRDKKTGLSADSIRMRQMGEVINGTYAKTDKLGVPREHVVFAGDTNSYNYAREQAEELGLWSAAKIAGNSTNSAYKTHNNWTKAIKGEHFDLVLVKKGTKVTSWSQHLSSSLSDHHIITVEFPTVDICETP